MKKIVSFLIALFFVLPAFSQEASGYEKKLFLSASGDSLPYRLLRPESVRPGEKYPLVLFLHGAGERGRDNEKQLNHGGRMFTNPVNRERHPAFVVAPQCPPEGYWAYPERPASFLPDRMPAGLPVTPLIAAVKALLDECLALPEVDKSRVYVVGLSMGGMATFDLACRYPEVFAAAVPICGTVNPARLEKAKRVSFRIFHGDADDIVPPDGSRAAYRALKRAGAQVEYIEFPGCNHGSWNPAFNYPGFMDWLFRQRK